MKKLLLIDGHSQMYRAIFTPGAVALSSPSGEVTTGTFVFTRLLLKLLREQKPDYVAMATDGPRNELERRKRFPEYKNNRTFDDEVPAGTWEQIPRMLEITELLGVKVIGHPGWEADDVIATLCKQNRKRVKCVVATRDKDFHQIVRKNVVLFDPMTTTLTDESDVIHRWGVPPKQVLEIQTLMGDATDNIPGVKGVGEKKALKLIKDFGSAKGAKKNALSLSPALGAAMMSADLGLCRMLVKLKTDLELGVGLEELSFSRPDMDAARELFSELGFKALARKRESVFGD